MDLLQYEFLRNALIVGSIIAILSAVVGYFVVLRGLSFAAEAIAHIGFAGATGAVLIGVNPIFGLLFFTVVAASVMGVLGEKVRGRDTSIGIVLSVSLGLGALFLSLYTRYATQVFSILFGTIVGVSMTDVAQTLILAVICIAVIGVIYKQLLFYSIDPVVAKAKGIPTTLLSVVFFIVLAVTVSIAVQVVGVLLIFTLILAPAATAQYLSSKPMHTILLAVLIALFEVWSGIIFAYYISWPVSFFISTIAFILYVAARLYNLAENR
jgi:zinc/manganese transport system permease protein